ncbi:MAG: Transcriptional regulator, TetR family [Thermoanaerobacterales bacterium 50_218]|nr:MAG: Transcriptional regulator, TetR family [Thermoanaerobacterales bacterium 50_218]HAA90473.1 TetR/AcrR family transcriptional regulator [Peptococcaceae bacterium]
MRRRPSNKGESNSQLKQRIITAAQKLFVKKDYHNTTIHDIVEEAGVSIGALYHYFASKEELARHIHHSAVHEFLSRYEREVRSQPTTKKKIQAFTSLMFQWAEDDPVMVEYLLYGRPKEILEKSFSICSEEGLQAVMEIVQEGIQKGEICPIEPFAAAALISGTIIRMIELRLIGIVSYPLSQISNQIAESIWRAINAKNF